MGDDAELYMETGGEPSILCDNEDDFSYTEEESIDFTSISSECKRCFFVDYENVNRVGLNGILKLSETDCVRIYYSKNAEAMTFGLHRRINASKAKFQYVKVQMPIKNATDCLILYHLQNLTRRRKDMLYYIVSNDADFDLSIEMFRQLKCQVYRVPEICQAQNVLKSQNTSEVSKDSAKPKVQPASKEKREAQVRSFYGKYCKEDAYKEKKEETVQAILHAKSKVDLNSQLTKLYPGSLVKQLFELIKPLIEDLPKN